MQAETIEGFRLSPQQRLTWLDQGDSSGLCTWGLLALEGPVAGADLVAALERAVERHEILRTRFVSLPGLDLPVQSPQETGDLAWREVDLGERPPEQRSAAVKVEVERLRSTRFDFAAGPLLHATCLHLGPEEGRLALAFPALLGGVASLVRLAEEVARELGGDAGEEDEPVQYVDVSEWQHELREAPEAAAGTAYWREHPGRRLEPVRLPLEGEVLEGLSPLLPPAVRHRLGPEIRERLEAAAGDVPPAARLAAAFAVLLARFSGEREVLLSSRSSGRQDPELAATLGPLARFLPLACRVGPEARFRDLAAAVARQMADNEAWQELADDLPGRGGFAFSVLPWPGEFSVDSGGNGGGGGLRFEALGGERERFRLHLWVWTCPEGLDCELHYRPEVYGRGSMEVLLDGFVTLLTTALEEPAAAAGELPLLSASLRKRILEAWNRTALPLPEAATRRVSRQLADREAEAPDSIALVVGEERWSRAGMGGRVRALARELARRGVGPEVAVGLALDRSAESILALLAVLEAGGAYVPLDPSLPPARLSFLVEETGASIVLAPGALADLFTATSAEVVPPGTAAGTVDAAAGTSVEVDADHPVYILYTSGSTGQPKGVVVRQGSLANLLVALDERIYADVGERRVGLNASLAFDASVKQLFQLTRGATLYLLGEEDRLAPERLLDYARRYRLDSLDCTPTQLALLLRAGLGEAGSPFPSKVLVGGEAIDGETWQRLAEAAEISCFNLYGPTEATVDAAVAPFAGSGEVPHTGGPLANVRVHVLDRHLHLLPPGLSGEVFLAGDGLARGYLGRPGLTAAAFVPDPFATTPGGRLYATGDRGRWLSSWDEARGRLQILDRLDHQVKLRGVRIELGEIEAALRSSPGVREAAVILSREKGGERLVAYVAAERLSAPTLDGRPRRRLPNGMAVVEQNPNETAYLYREIFETESYTRHGIHLPDEAVVFDVGANIGMFSLFVKQVRPGARIHAFEPIAPIFETLRANVGLYAPRMELHPVGLSDREREVTFTYYPRYSMMSGQTDYADPGSEVEVVKTFLANALARGDAPAAGLLEHADELLAGRFDEERQPGRLRRLSDVIAETGVAAIDLLKIDVQRAELDVLRGLDDGDWEKVRQIVMELHDPAGPDAGHPQAERPEGRIRELSALLGEKGFAVHVEQDELLAGTDRFVLYAVRPGEGRQLRPGAPGTMLAASPTPELPPLLSVDGLRDGLRQRLPEAMVPALVVFLDRLPVNASGKLDRRALPAPESLQPELRSGFVAPRNQAEETIADVWQEVLGVARVGIHDNFFDLGGHSLTLVQVHGKLREVFDREISMLDMFQRPTVGDLAAFLAGGGEEPGAKKALAAIDERARRKIDAVRRRQQVLAGRRSER